jgi:hypothetical protein
MAGIPGAEVISNVVVLPVPVVDTRDGGRLEGVPVPVLIKMDVVDVNLVSPVVLGVGVGVGVGLGVGVGVGLGVGVGVGVGFALGGFGGKGDLGAGTGLGVNCFGVEP